MINILLIYLKNDEGEINLLNIVIPMAGRGSRFANAGYERPKPLILIKNKPMIELVVNNLRPKCSYRFIFLCLEEHIEKYSLENFLKRMEPNSVIVPVKEVTEGAACTVLLAKEFISNENPLMIANSDQYIDYPIDQYLLKGVGVDGLIMTMTAYDNKWSFIKFDNKHFVTEVKEKEVISEEATVGIYNFSKGSDFVFAAERMIKKNIRTNNEFYVAPVYNEMIQDGKKITYCNIQGGMYGLGTPEDLDRFLKTEIYNNL